MTVAELIAKLQTLPQHLDVCVNDERGGTFHEEIDAVFDIDEDKDNDESACVIIAVNPF